jgi:hypothetical protein
MRRPLVIVELAGGLGNQIFLLQMARYVSSLISGKILINISHIDSEQFSGKSTIQDFKFNKNEKIFRYNKFIKRLMDFVKKYIKNFKKLNQDLVLILDENDYNSSTLTVEEIIALKHPSVVYIIGYWQSFLYWKLDSKYELANPSFKYLEASKTIGLNLPIVFHYRIGAYGQKWQYQWGVLSPDYLYNVLNFISSDMSDTKNSVWIFSDNITLAKQFLSSVDFPEKFELLYFDDSGMSPAEVLMLLASSSLLVCGNSTFSLAAAKIGKIKKVFVPSSFSKHDQVELSLPQNWNSIESVWLE